MKVQINIERLLSYDAVTSKLTLIRVLHGFLVDQPFQEIYRDEQLAPNLKLITWLTSLYAREGARTLRIYIFLSFDCKTCYSAFNGSRQFFTGTRYQVPVVPDTIRVHIGTLI